MNKHLTIALASDENYLDGLVGTLSGVARRVTATEVRVVVMDCGISEESWLDFELKMGVRWPVLRLMRLRITADQLVVFNLTGAVNHLNNANFARLLLPELLPDVDRIIYMDCDVMVDADISLLADVDLEGALVGAVRDYHCPRLAQNLPGNAVGGGEADQPAFNSGVLVMDLEAVRGSDLIMEIMKLPAAFQEKFQDQAVLNYLLRGRWKRLDACWNRQRFVTENFSIYRDHPDSLWHFIGKMKPWYFHAGSDRGLVADFMRDLRSSGWSPRKQGAYRLLSPLWRDTLKALRAFCLRGFRHWSEFRAAKSS